MGSAGREKRSAKNVEWRARRDLCTLKRTAEVLSTWTAERMMLPSGIQSAERCIVCVVMSRRLVGDDDGRYDDTEVR